MLLPFGRLTDWLIAPLPEREPPGGAEPDGAAYCLILRDITDKREASERRRREAFGDYLTGLANQCASATAYAQAASPSRPNYIAMTSGGTQGVGRATTNAVVTASVLVIAVDFFLTRLLITLLY